MHSNEVVEEEEQEEDCEVKDEEEQEQEDVLIIEFSELVEDFGDIKDLLVLPFDDECDDECVDYVDNDGSELIRGCCVILFFTELSCFLSPLIFYYDLQSDFNDDGDWDLAECEDS
ncbi:MAG: hypothetical protein EZS28_015557 [Streblomastix strix]|uniref:Uncharacterized protein n=1 Tax=Streblomastix strix TaxID=222440 RepID=A0A5J4W207_9EUKA|nr:MAG: hypothetical protein EZS28_015557 [Streblomastix strix]